MYRVEHPLTQNNATTKARVARRTREGRLSQDACLPKNILRVYFVSVVPSWLHLQSPEMAKRPHSSLVLDGPERAPGRAMLHAVGFTRDDFAKSQVGVCSTWSQV